MTDKPTPTLRPGQRVRLTIEGTVKRNFDGSLSLSARDEGVSLSDRQGCPYLVLRIGTVEVLAEPRPDDG